MDTSDLLKAIAVTAELTGTEMSEAAKAAMVSDLAEFPVPQVLGALSRCRRELKGRMRVADVIDRLDDGRPGPEEAWALCPRTEDDTVVWTDEMAQAFGVAHALILSGDMVAARMAFREKYVELVTKARGEHVPITWTPSLGHSMAGREGPIREAVEKGRLPAGVASQLLPAPVSKASTVRALSHE